MNTNNTISEVTRRLIFDKLTLGGKDWAGQMQDDEFLNRLYDLKALPSTDYRYKTAGENISKHTIMNNDWSRGWIFTDPRFNLLRSDDSEFLSFLAETVHPLVRRDAKENAQLVQSYNQELQRDGWELSPISEISGFPVFGGRRTLQNSNATKAASQILSVIDSGYLTRQITRMEQSIMDDPELAIGTAKEFVESIAKTIVIDAGEGVPDDFQKLIRLAIKKSRLAPEDIPDGAKAADTIRILLNNLQTVAIKLNELRGPYGTGHGKHAMTKGLETRHARLAVNSAIAFGVFLFNSYFEE